MRWAYNSIDSRNTYHKKQAAKTKLLVRMAKEQLGADELERIDEEAESEL
jgi:hypothetical protein